MKQLLTLTAFLVVFSFTAKSQCNSTLTYDFVASGNTVLPPSPASPYTSAYVCAGSTFTDSMSCCTRVVHVDVGGTYIPGPQAYGIAYVKSGGVFDNSLNSPASSWTIYADPPVTVINHPFYQCVNVSFASASCATGAGSASPVPVSVVQRGQELCFYFASPAAALRVELYDMSGKLVRMETAANVSQHILSTAALPDGIYFCRVSNGEEVIYLGKTGIVQQQ